MKQVQCTFKSKKGNITTRGINTSGSAKKAAETLHQQAYPFFELVGFEVVKVW